jgi:hypothetical protein
VHTKFHIRLALRLPVYNKHLIVTIICDTILLNQIAQIDDVDDCSCAELHILVVARHSGFPSHYHITTIAFSLMLLVDLQVLLTKDALQKRSIVD